MASTLSLSCAGFTYGNGIVHTLTRNARGLPEESKDAYGSTKFLDDVYDYDAVGNVAAITDGATNQGQHGNRTMTYDGLDRLTDVVSPMYGTAGVHYSYDVLDNLVHTIAVNRDQWLCYDQFNRLSNVKDGGDCSTGNTILGLGYDAQGNLNNWNGKLHNFDYGIRLRSVTDVESYRYDAHGHRIRACTPSAGLLYSLYSHAGQLLWQRDSRSSKRREYIHLNGSLVAERTRPIGSTAETITYQHTDALGTPVLKTSAGRVILERREYEPYGKLLNLPLESGPGYTAHDTDPDTQYTYMQQRYYDSRVGRFWSVDPVTVDSVGGNFNRYWYANNNPYRFTDPDGRESVGEMIDRRAMEAAISGNNASTYGWAVASVAWSAFGAEGLSQTYDKGESAGASNNAMAILEVATLGKGSMVARGATWAGATSKGAISFCKNSNQISHTFRHAIDAGISLRNVATRVVRDLNKVANSLEAGKTVNRTVTVGGKSLQYVVHKLDDGTLRVGRIKVLKEQ